MIKLYFKNMCDNFSVDDLINSRLSHGDVYYIVVDCARVLVYMIVCCVCQSTCVEHLSTSVQSTARMATHDVNRDFMKRV